MARDSQPPPPQLIADLHDRLEALQAEYDSFRQSTVNSTETAIASAVTQMESEILMTREDLRKSRNQLEELQKLVAEREAEIEYLQGQLETAVLEMAELRKNRDFEDLQSSSNVPSPVKLVQDMKNRLLCLEERLSNCNISTSNNESL